MEILNTHIVDSEIIGASALMTEASGAGNLFWKCGFIIYTKQNKIEIWSNTNLDEAEKRKDFASISKARAEVIAFIDSKTKVHAE